MRCARHLEAEGNARQWIVEQAPAPALAIMALAERVASDEFTVRTAVELSSHDDEIGRIVAGVHREVAHLFGELIGQGQCDGEIDGAVDPDQAGNAVVGLCIGAGVIGVPPVVLQQQVRALLRMPSSLPEQRSSGPWSRGPTPRLSRRASRHHAATSPGSGVGAAGHARRRARTVCALTGRVAAL